MTSQPVIETPPAVLGTPKVGGLLVASTGVWLHGPASSAGYTFQWLSQPAGARAYTKIPGATSVVYTPQPADTGAALYVSVTATTPAGVGVAVSAGTAPVAGPPVNVVPPVIEGAEPVTVGETVTVTEGTWK